MGQELQNFLDELDEKQKEEYSKLDLFNPEKTKDLTEEQKKYFVKIFYHTRAHFDRLLWMRLTHAPNLEEKKKILSYLAEEAGIPDIKGEKNLASHEILFERFAKSLGLVITSEITEEDGFLPFARDFSKELINWFMTNNWETQKSGFSAYERLDNIDYDFMLELAKNLGVNGKDLEFFEVHKNADHFDNVSFDLKEEFEKNPDNVKDAFNWIYSHQLKMWQNLSKESLSHN